MGEPSKSEKTVREYLLGRVSDEAMLEELEELLFTDEEFCSQVALAEDGLINDYVFGNLDDANADSFRATLADNPERRFKLELTQALREKALARRIGAAGDERKPSFVASLKAFFRRPKYVAAFAASLVAALALAIYFVGRGSPDELAELRAIYGQERPTETRIAEFGYAPLAQLRGGPESREQNRLRRIENSLLIKVTEKTSDAQAHHALGVFHLTQRKYADAIREFESAARLAGDSAKIHNDLGAAYFELAKTSATEKRLEALSRALEEFTKATELDGNLLEALFNRSLALQEFGALPREAKESWGLYLRKDSSSPWADEARRNLARLESERTSVKTDEQVLGDFLTAYRARDEARAQKIHNETKGLLREPSVPLQLSRRYLLAKRRGDEAEARESVEAMAFVGGYERAQYSEAFFSELADYYAGVGANKAERLLEAKESFARAYQSINRDEYAKVISEFEKSRDQFAALGNAPEAAAAESWAVQFLPDVAKVAEGRRRLEALIADAEARRFNVLIPTAYYWLAVSHYRQIGLSQTAKNFKTALRLAEAGGNVFGVQYAQEALASHYSGLGELEPALAYAGKMLPGRDLYYPSPAQSWREKGTLADLSLKLKFFATSLSFSKEALVIAREISPTSLRVNQNLLNMVNASAARKDFAAALGYADESKRIALGRAAS